MYRADAGIWWKYFLNINIHIRHSLRHILWNWFTKFVGIQHPLNNINKVLKHTHTTQMSARIKSLLCVYWIYVYILYARNEGDSKTDLFIFGPVQSFAMCNYGKWSWKTWVIWKENIHGKKHKSYQASHKFQNRTKRFDWTRNN